MKKLRLSFNIEEDKELRDYVKNIIRGQIVSLIRENVMDVLTETLKDQKEKIVQKALNTDPQEVIERYIRQIAKESLLERKSCWNTTFAIHDIAKEIIKQEVFISQITDKMIKDAIIEVVQGKVDILMKKLK